MNSYMHAWPYPDLLVLPLQRYETCQTLIRPSVLLKPALADDLITGNPVDVRILCSYEAAFDLLIVLGAIQPRERFVLTYNLVDRRSERKSSRS